MTEPILFTQDPGGVSATPREQNDGFEDEYPDGEFLDVDIQTALETAEECGVRKTPTALAFATGEQTVGFIGIVDRDGLEPAIQSATQQSSGLTQHLVDSVGG